MNKNFQDSHSVCFHLDQWGSSLCRCFRLNLWNLQKGSRTLAYMKAAELQNLCALTRHITPSATYAFRSQEAGED